MTKCNNTLEFDKQIEFTGKAYIDPKQMPVDTKAELDEMTMATGAFIGMEKTVLHDEEHNNEMVKYKFNGDKWEIAYKDIFITGDDVE